MKKTVKMEIVNAHAAGIDIGSKSHFVAIGQGKDEIKEFNVSHSGHLAMVKYLTEAGTTTIAMESTGSYWQSLYLVLIQSGFNVQLIPGSSLRNFKKTDVKDAQSIQRLHSLGMLSSCFLPEDEQARLRELSRHRKNIIQQISKATLRMQKCLRMMNFRLDVAVNDIVGKSGLLILRAILSGVTNPQELAALASMKVKKNKEEIADALHGNPREELIFELKQNLEAFDFFQDQLGKVDQKVEELLSKIKTELEDNHLILKKKQTKGKNQIRVPIQKFAYKLFGVDLMSIQGVSVNTVFTLISEVGIDIHKFETAKAFASWLRLSPNNKVTGGKVVSSRTPKGKNPLSQALRDAANVIGNQKQGPLTNFFKKIGLRKGRCAAITATARKLAVIIYKMIKDKTPYNPVVPEYIQEKINRNKLKSASSFLSKIGYRIVDNQGLVFS
jgi:transposase